MALEEKDANHIEIEESESEFEFITSEEDADYTEGSGADSDSSCEIVEDERDKLSRLSVGKRLKSGDKDENVDSVDEIVVPSLIQAGKLEKLKVDELKFHLRSYRLRLTGNKNTLIQRIKEHQQLLKGRGQNIYPASSFVLNCKGDACAGDVVMFEQNVYENYNIASRSASASGLLGRRTVAGRILRESYGSAKQQHTFTIEVLWSKGEKPLPPLHQLLIKGRNLYRFNTFRQRWEDEGKRSKILMEKHSRGSLARSDRESRIQEKEKRKMVRKDRATRKYQSNIRKQSQVNENLIAKVRLQDQQLGYSVNLEEAIIQRQQFSGPAKLASSAMRVHPKSSTCTSTGAVKITDTKLQQATIRQQYSTSFTSTETKSCHAQTDDQQVKVFLNYTRNCVIRESQQQKSYEFGSTLPTLYHHSQFDQYCNRNLKNDLQERHYHRQPLTIRNHYNHMNPSERRANKYLPTDEVHIFGYPQKQKCRYFAQGRCRYENNCKFLHE